MKHGLTGFASEPTNPHGYAAYGLYIINNGQQILKEGIFVGQGKGISNNLAEYSAFVKALIFLKNKRYSKETIIIRGDSKLVIEQMLGNWRIKSGLYTNLAHKAKLLIEEFKNITLQWIPREENEICDKLAKDVLRSMEIKFRIQPDKL